MEGDELKELCMDVDETLWKMDLYVENSYRLKFILLTINCFHNRLLNSCYYDISKLSVSFPQLIQIRKNKFKNVLSSLSMLYGHRRQVW